jgi:hypothetical protein
MAISGTWFPRRRIDQLVMAVVWGPIMLSKGTAWKISAAVIGNFVDLIAAARSALAATVVEATRTPVTTGRCRAAFGALEKEMWSIKNRYFLAPPLSTEDFISLGLEPDDPVIPRPTAQPTADIIFPGKGQVELIHIRPVAGPSGDSRSDHGLALHYGLTGAPSRNHPLRISGPPVNVRELPYTRACRRKRELIDFPGESGNEMFFSLNYETPAGGEDGKGPSSALLRAVIP